MRLALKDNRHIILIKNELRLSDFVSFSHQTMQSQYIYFLLITRN